nr:60S acidic ribosomal protein P1 [Cryptomonas curvata]
MWSSENKNEISCILAGLILIENNIEITEKKIITLLSFAGIKFERYWPNTFVRLSQNFDLLELTGCKKEFQITKPLNETTKDLDIDKIEPKEKQMKEISIEIESEGGDMGFGLFD